MSYVAERLEVLESLWLETGGRFCGTSYLESRGINEAQPAALAKLASVSLIGVWACREIWRYRLETSSCPMDVRVEGKVWTRPTPGSPTDRGGSSVFCDFITRQLVQKLASMRPVHQHCIEMERLMVAKMMIVLRSFCQPQYLRSVRVDVVMAHVVNSDKNKTIARSAGIEYSNVRPILPPGRSARYQPVNSSSARVFRVKELPMAVYPGGALSLRTEEPRSLLALYDWTSLEEPTECSDCFQQRLIDHACSGKSMCVMGAAGCG